MEIPDWLRQMDEEDLQFIKRFVLASGSLKELAEVYAVSYPTLRARLDRLIAKVQVADDQRPQDAFERKLRILVADGKLSPSVAKNLMSAHKASLQRAPVKKGKK